MPTRDPTGPPTDLDTEGKAMYRKLRAALRKADRWTDSDQHALASTCRHAMAARKARAGIPRDAKGGLVLVVRGSRGQDVAHPNVKIASDAESKFMDGLKELGLTPAARARLHLGLPGSGRPGRDPLAEAFRQGSGHNSDPLGGGHS